MAHVDLICPECGLAFKRQVNEYNRGNKRGRKHYCSAKCACKYNIENIPADKRYHPENLVPSGWQLDNLSPFRYMFRVMKRHAAESNKEFSLELHDLREQWNKQQGVCPYTGWSLILPRTTGHSPPKTPDKASVDRIRSDVGYVKGNIQFVAMIAQFAKHDWDDSVLLEFGRALVAKHE